MSLAERVRDMMPFPSLGEEPPNRATAEALTDRYHIADILRIRAFDTENNLAVIDEGDRISLGAVFMFSPLLAAGLDTERQLGSLIKELPHGSSVQFAMLGWPDTYGALNAWARARTEKAPKQILKDMVQARIDHYTRTSRGVSLTKEGDLFPRSYRCFLSLYIPGPKDQDEGHFNRYLKEMVRRTDAYKGKLKACGMPARQMDQTDLLRLYRMMYNPSMLPEDLDKKLIAGERIGGALPRDVMDKSTRLRVSHNGDLVFTSSGKATHCRAITVDMYPEEHYLFNQRRLIGDMLDGSSRIPAPFWAYTNINVMDPQTARDQMMTRLGLINKQTLSDSPWFRSMLGPLVDRRNQTEAVLSQTAGEHSLVRAYTGINIYGPEHEIENYADSVKSLWNKSGFQCSEEHYISLPAFIASNPLGYVPDIDAPNRGLQRAEIMTTLNASTLLFCAADWPGTPPENGGPLLVTRRGQVSTIDLFTSETNYNFVVAASSGSGKSFFSNEICVDFLSRNGIVRIIDVGRSYQNLSGLIGGQVIEYDLNNPRSINPFWGVANEQELAEMLPMFKSMLTLMAYPRHEPPAWEYQNLENIVADTWAKRGAHMELAHIYEALMASEDDRARDIGDQIKSYAIGRLSKWFNGEREVGFENDFAILELDGLNSDKELRNVVFAQTIHSITRDMYLSGSDRPKLLLIDEAWDLMGSGADSTAAADFIETAARRVRKYGGALGTVTQSYNDYYQSAAARAALENSAWRVTLRQKSESLQVARDKGVFPPKDELVWKLLETVNSGSDYSEIHISNDQAGEVFRFFVDPLSYWIYTTNPKDRAKISELARQKGCTQIEAIYEIANAQIAKLEKQAAEGR